MRSHGHIVRLLRPTGRAWPKLAALCLEGIEVARSCTVERPKVSSDRRGGAAARRTTSADDSGGPASGLVIAACVSRTSCGWLTSLTWVNVVGVRTLPSSSTYLLAMIVGWQVAQAI